MELQINRVRINRARPVVLSFDKTGIGVDSIFRERVNLTDIATLMLIFYFWWLDRVILVSCFWLLYQNLGGGWGPMNGILSFQECRFNVGDTVFLNFLTSQVEGI